MDITQRLTRKTLRRGEKDLPIIVVLLHNTGADIVNQFIEQRADELCGRMSYEFEKGCSQFQAFFQFKNYEFALRLINENIVIMVSEKVGYPTSIRRCFECKQNTKSLIFHSSGETLPYQEDKQCLECKRGFTATHDFLSDDKLIQYLAE